MAASGLCCGLYRGTIFLKDLSDPNAALLPVGNAEATIAQELVDIEQPNYQSLGGANCKVSYVDSVSIDLTLHCTSPENLAIAFLGTSAQLAGAAVVDEVHAVNDIEELIPFEFVPNRNLAIVVEPEGGGTAYVLKEDYILTNAGIQIIEGSTIPIDGSEIQVSYTYGANWKLDAQTVGQKEFLLVLDGFNVGDSGEKAVVLKAWKVKFAPTDSFALISGEEFASIAVSGEILRDNSKSVGSKFFTVEWGSETNGGY